MAIMKIGRALFIAYSIVSCVLLARVNVARADLGGDQTIGDAAHRTVRSSKSKDDLARRRPIARLPVVGTRTSTGQRNLCDARRNFRSRYVTESTQCGEVQMLSTS